MSSLAERITALETQMTRLIGDDGNAGSVRELKNQVSRLNTVLTVSVVVMLGDITTRAPEFVKGLLSIFAK